MVDVKFLSDCDLQNELNKLGFSPGPILCMYSKYLCGKYKRLGLIDYLEDLNLFLVKETYVIKIIKLKIGIFFF